MPGRSTNVFSPPSSFFLLLFLLPLFSFFLLFPFFAGRSIPTTYFGLFSPVCAPFPPPLPLPWQKNGNSRGPVHGFLVNFAANRRRPPMSTTRKNVLDRVTGQFLLRRRRGEKKKEACVYIYTYFIYIYICIFCSIGRRSGAILEIM